MLKALYNTVRPGFLRSSMRASPPLQPSARMAQQLGDATDLKIPFRDSLPGLVLLEVITWGHQDDNCGDPELNEQLVNVAPAMFFNAYIYSIL